MTERPPSAADALAEQWSALLEAALPATAVTAGAALRGFSLDGYGMDQASQLRDDAAALRRRLAQVSATDDVDTVTLRELASHLDGVIENHDAGWHLRELDAIDSPVVRMAQAVAMHPTATADDLWAWETTLASVPDAVHALRDTLSAGLARGSGPAPRQAIAAAAFARAQARADGPFGPARGRSESAGKTLENHVPTTLARALDRAAAGAARAYDDFADFLTHTIARQSTTPDAVGADLYAMRSRHFLGLDIDLRDTYAWGLDEVARAGRAQDALLADMGHASLADAVERLDADPAHWVDGADGLERWLRARIEEATAATDGTIATLPPSLGPADVGIERRAGGARYSPPSVDHSRRGTVWWPFAPHARGKSTWRDLTTVAHEAVPGHHLQMGGAVLNDTLNSWRRRYCARSGHLEGWGLYAEQLMADVGWFSDPAHLLGLLDAQRLRAARVVVDIGLHLSLRSPSGRVWDAAEAAAYLRDTTSLDDTFIDVEVTRYLGWPGQAPAYAVGMRQWRQAHTVATAEGRLSSLEFHDRVLAMGGMGLATLRHVADNLRRPPRA